MKKLMFGLMMAAALGLAGCQQSVQDAAKDVRDAEKHRDDKVTEKVRDLQDTKMNEDKKVIDEKRDLNDAINREANKDNTAPPPVVPATP